MSLDQDQLPDIQIFEYHRAGDFFTIHSDYARISDTLELGEWNDVVWIGRLFAMDNDFGEHWFDNWPEREEKEEVVSGLAAQDQQTKEK